MQTEVSGGITQIFILRPIATTLLMCALLLIGILGYRALPVASLPEVDYPNIQVVTFYPGASPEVMAKTVTAPLERQLGQIAGLQQISSQSSNGASIINLQFQLSLSLDVAEQEVQAAINAAATFLPPALPWPPLYQKVNPADPPILTLAVTSKSLPIFEVEDFVETRLAAKIAQISGVGRVSLAGGQRPAIRIKFNGLALAARGLSSDSIRSAIANANISSAKGSLDGHTRAWTFTANDTLKTVEDYRQLIVAYKDNAPVYLKDIAQVVRGPENDQIAAWANHAAAILLNVQRQPGANVIKTTYSIRSALPTLLTSLPQSITVSLITDRTNSIRSSVLHIQSELLLATLLVIFVIYLFLGSARATFIPSLAIPLSLLGTLAVIYCCGFSINNLTLMALTIATGFVVDDAIVVIENITRYLEKGEKPLQAALKGCGEISFTIISLTFSLVAVLLPLLFMQDVLGRLFREFAVTLAVAILISALISLTFTPMLCAKLLSSTASQSMEMQPRAVFFTSLLAHYEVALRRVLAYPKVTLMVLVGTLILTVLLYARLPKGFFPIQDTGMIEGTLLLPQQVYFTQMAQQQKLVTALLQDPAVANISSFIGIDGNNITRNQGRLQITLKPMAQRDDLTIVLSRLRQLSLHLLETGQLYLHPLQDLTLDTQLGQSQYHFTLQASTTEELSQWLPTLLATLQQDSLLQDVSSDWQEKGLIAFINVNRDSASRLGLQMKDIDNALYNAFGQGFISTLYTTSNQYRVLLEQEVLHPQNALKALAEFYLTNGQGASIPLNSFAQIEEKLGLLAINHLGQFPTARVFFNLGKGISLGEALEHIQQRREEIKLPQSLILQFQGISLALQSSVQSTVWLILAAIIAMYIVLGILYESYIHPVTILSTLPTASLGALLALQFSGKELDIIAIIGIILLIGIVKKNAIMMIDFALSFERNKKLMPREAIMQACLLRLRPILMTTLAAMLSALPLMLSTGIGKELRQPLGICMVGGLIVSQLLTLFTTPVIYLLFARLTKHNTCQ